ncbi:MAG: uridine diphosphate-N-acetylglucosamine-binding protein YvcK [Candidatus Diapherotrites archaeon]|nr:uridine diphosphate-N-acetylglucosamine-binding protein YvcK [Candidatus Diapherotrites archaeon]
MTIIKAIIFDLDDTLFDCTGQLVETARMRAAESMSKHIPATSDDLYKKIIDIEREYGPKTQVFDKVCDAFKPDNRQECIRDALHAYNADEVEEISLFPEAVPLFRKIKKTKIKLVLVSSGIYSRQMRKVQLLGLDKWMDLILIHDIEKDVSKEILFEQVLKQFDLKPDEVVAIGDRVHNEIRFGNKLGMTTIQIMHGRYQKNAPKHMMEEPDFKINKLSEIPKLLRLIEKGKNNKPKIVAIGGGTGLPVVLSCLKEHTPYLTAIVTVTDSGRSSGTLRKDLNILPPGDIRNCLIALSDSGKLLKNLFSYRFKKGMLADQSFGNLFIAALTKTTGSFEKALKQVSRILAIRGQVLPSTLENVHINAELEDGSVLHGEDTIIERTTPPKELAKRSPLKRVFLTPASAGILPEAKKAILNANLIIIGPGSLYTSVITNLLVKGMKDAIKKSKAKKVFIANVMTQVNQTHGYALSDQVRAIEKYLGKNALDFVVYNTKKPGKQLLQRYAKQCSFFSKNDLKNIKGSKAKLVGAALIEKPPKKFKKASKQELLRHDSKKLAKILLGLLQS